MKKHLVIESTRVADLTKPMIELSGWSYWTKRLQFWKWRKHYTMGRPVLKFRKENQ